MRSHIQATLDELIHPIADAMSAFESAYTSVFRDELPFLLPVLSYIGQKHGKRLRPILFFLSQGLVSAYDSKSVSTAVMLELLHTATLIHDDVVDGSLERRGEKSLNAVWGDRVSVLVGDFLFARVLELGVHAGSERILQIVSRVVSDMGRGELRQELEDASRVMTVEEYNRHIKEKTAGLFIAACYLGGLAANGSADELKRLEAFGENYGMAFQIRDDILDFSGHERDMGKPVGQDLTNGKITLPLIIALERSDESERRNIMQLLDEGEGETIRAFVRERDGLAGAQDKAGEFMASALEILATFADSVYRQSLEHLVEFDLRRVG